MRSHVRLKRTSQSICVFCAHQLAGLHGSTGIARIPARRPPQWRGLGTSRVNSQAASASQAEQVDDPFDPFVSSVSGQYVTPEEQAKVEIARAARERESRIQREEEEAEARRLREERLKDRLESESLFRPNLISTMSGNPQVIAGKRDPGGTDEPDKTKTGPWFGSPRSKNQNGQRDPLNQEFENASPSQTARNQRKSSARFWNTPIMDTRPEERNDAGNMHTFTDDYPNGKRSLRAARSRSTRHINFGQRARHSEDVTRPTGIRDRREYISESDRDFVAMSKSRGGITREKAIADITNKMKLTSMPKFFKGSQQPTVNENITTRMPSFVPPETQARIHQEQRDEKRLREWQRAEQRRLEEEQLRQAEERQRDAERRESEKKLLAEQKRKEREEQEAYQAEQAAQWSRLQEERRQSHQGLTDKVLEDLQAKDAPVSSSASNNPEASREVLSGSPGEESGAQAPSMTESKSAPQVSLKMGADGTLDIDDDEQELLLRLLALRQAKKAKLAASKAREDVKISTSSPAAQFPSQAEQSSTIAGRPSINSTTAEEGRPSPDTLSPESTQNQNNPPSPFASASNEVVSPWSAPPVRTNTQGPNASPYAGTNDRRVSPKLPGSTMYQNESLWINSLLAQDRRRSQAQGTASVNDQGAQVANARNQGSSHTENATVAPAAHDAVVAPKQSRPAEPEITDLMRAGMIAEAASRFNVPAPGETAIDDDSIRPQPSVYEHKEEEKEEEKRNVRTRSTLLPYNPALTVGWGLFKKPGRNDSDRYPEDSTRDLRQTPPAHLGSGVTRHKHRNMDDRPEQSPYVGFGGPRPEVRTCTICGQVGHIGYFCPDRKKRAPPPLSAGIDAASASSLIAQSTGTDALSQFEDERDVFGKEVAHRSDTGEVGFRAPEPTSSPESVSQDLFSREQDSDDQQRQSRSRLLAMAGAQEEERDDRPRRKHRRGRRQDDEEIDDNVRGRGRGGRSSFARELDEDHDDVADNVAPRRTRRRADDELNELDELSDLKKIRDMRQRERQERRSRYLEAEKRRSALVAKRSQALSKITLPQFITVSRLAQALSVKVEHLTRKMESLGFTDTAHDHVLTADTASMIALEYNFDPAIGTELEVQDRDLKPRPEPEDKSSLPSRPPIVTIMGHVDHGKTTILDYLRKSSIAATEHGGITQHIGAFSVRMSGGKLVTFLDTPGHAAFLSMRKRGATVTDIIVLVVAADDSVKPQTLEAIKHAQEAHVPMIVAVSKVDKPEADVQRVKDDLSRHGIEIEDYGGDVQVVAVSGKTGQGMDDLEEAVVTLGEILDHRAQTDGEVEGWVLEATTKAAGRVATVLVRRGTLRVGDVIVAGKTWTKARSLKNEAGARLSEALPGMPVEVDGWRDQPVAGDLVLEAPSEQKAADVVDYRTELTERVKLAEDVEAINETRRLEQERRQREKERKEGEEEAGNEDEDEPSTRTNDPANTNTVKEVPFIVKADVSGSAEAVVGYLQQLINPLCSPRIIRSGVGQVSEFDVEHAAAAQGHIISFNQPPPDENIAGMATTNNVQLIEQNVIYRLLDQVKAILEKKLEPVVIQKVTGEAEVLQPFEIGVGGRRKLRIAGSKVKNGEVKINSRVRVLRGGETVYDGKISSLKNVKKDVAEMRKGTECGIGFDDWDDAQTGDQIQTFNEVAEKRKLPF